MDLYQGIKNVIDFRINAREEYEKRIASRELILDVGGEKS
jgi:hypothetical protein